MGVVVEAVDEPLAHVLVDEGVVGHVVHPDVELLPGGQFAVQQQVGDLEIGRVFGELLDRVAAVAKDAGVAVEVGDRRLARRGRQVRRVVAVQRRIEFTQRRRGEDSALDRNGDGLTGAVVGDGDRVGHVASSRGANLGGKRLEVPPRPHRHVSAEWSPDPQPHRLRAGCCRACGRRVSLACPGAPRARRRSRCVCRRDRSRRRPARGLQPRRG